MLELVLHSPVAKTGTAWPGNVSYRHYIPSQKLMEYRVCVEETSITETDNTFSTSKRANMSAYEPYNGSSAVDTPHQANASVLFLILQSFCVQTD